MTNEQKQQLNELLRMQRAEERRERDRARRAAERYVNQRWGLTFADLDVIVQKREDEAHNQQKYYM